MILKSFALLKLQHFLDLSLKFFITEGHSIFLIQVLPACYSL